MSWAGKRCLFTIPILIKNYTFQNDSTSESFGLKIGALTKLGLFFQVVCFIRVFLIEL